LSPEPPGAALARRPSGLTACFTLKERLAAEPEEESVAAETADAIELSDLHAKLYVTESGSEAHVWTGSANATTAAFENNVEFMVELKGPRKRFGINALMEPEKGEVRFINLLEPADAAVASESPSPAVEELERLLEVRARISGARLKVRVTPASDGGFDLVLASSGEVNLQLGRGVAVTCWPCTLSSGAAVAVRTSTDQVLARFPSISLAAVTAFVAFRVSGQAGGEKLQIEFVLNLPLDGAPDGRKEQVLRSIVQDRSRMLKFLWLLLADELADLPRELVGGGSAAGQGAEVGTIPAIGGLFEMLLRTLDRAPERLDYLNGLMADIRKDATQPDLLPAGFDDIWLPIWRERERTRVPRS
jgi:hypothetical protein